MMMKKKIDWDKPKKGLLKQHKCYFPNDKLVNYY